MDIRYEKAFYGHKFGVKIDDAAYALVIGFKNEEWFGRMLFTEFGTEQFIDVIFTDENVTTKSGNKWINGIHLKDVYSEFISEIINHEQYRLIVTLSNAPLFIRNKSKSLM